jgi:hypothetical protein
MKKILDEGDQIHNFISSSGSGTVINYGSGSGTEFLTSYGSSSGSGSPISILNCLWGARQSIFFVPTHVL